MDNVLAILVYFIVYIVVLGLWGEILYFIAPNNIKKWMRGNSIDNNNIIDNFFDKLGSLYAFVGQFVVHMGAMAKIIFLIPLILLAPIYLLLAPIYFLFLTLVVIIVRLCMMLIFIVRAVFRI